MRLSITTTSLLAADALTISNKRVLNATKDAVLLFDGMASTKGGELFASIPAFVYEADVNTSVLEPAFASYGISGLDMDTAMSRAGLLAAVGIADIFPVIDFAACSHIEAILPPSDVTDLGMSLGTVALGSCNWAHQLTGVLSVDPSTTNTVYSVSPTGFGVISDIDDTIKITNVTETQLLLTNTFISNPEPVAGMPELYASLVSSLDDPDFIYLTGTPWQFYSFVHDFIQSTFSASPGPIINNNLTVTDVTQVFTDLLTLDTYSYKVKQITRIHAMYPDKTFLVVGDSGQTDPEVYGEIYRTYGDFIACIWIRQLADTNTTIERYGKAFKGVPEDRSRLYWDNEIEGLADIDVASGSC
ncbi:hypothetical protein CPB85DRAFT_1445428 [Mucidula mucida]|nr:hypothetical protein CPB85DRAFT_1445428 [Mucidula mucida]